MSAEEEIARIRRLELAGAITQPEAEVLVVAARRGRPISAVHALSRLDTWDLRNRWVLSAENGTNPARFIPASRDQLVAQILDRVS